ncbi:MAG: hypothetical protein HFI23_16920 [Lachnospiraceae bacterium]|jgi:hypothetical protein|nr:hypothetical protein [Lachnospiraceae bacterium]
MEKRYTRKNPNGSFRIPAENAGEIRMSQTGISIAFFGDAINKLGQYEELLTLEEARRYTARRTK